MKKIIVMILMLGMILISGPAAAAAQNESENYNDVKGNQAENEIETVCALGLMHGMGINEQGDKMFAPESLVNRSQLAQVLTDTFNLNYGSVRFIKQPLASDYYNDVNNKAWYANAVVMCSINKIFTAGESFYPDKTVTRLEAAEAVYRSFTAKGILVPVIMVMPTYQDTTQLSAEEVNAITFVSNTGIIKGDGQNFNPTATVKRVELAQIIWRCTNIMQIDENYNGKDYQIAPGDSFVLSLPGNPTTGYSWNINDSYDEKIVNLQENTYKIDYSGASGKDIMGRGGRQYWKFKALQAGTVQLNLVYIRPWEKNSAPAQTFTLKITVAVPDSGNTQVTISTEEVKSENENINVDMKIPVLKGLKDEKVESALNAAWKKEALDFEQQTESGFNDYIKERKESDAPVFPFDVATDYQECYLNNGVLSMYIDYYQYTGGAHGITDRRAYNIDLNTGANLSLSDIFKDGYDYKNVINQEISRQIQANPEEYFTDPGFETITDDQGYYLQNGSLVIFFQLYEIAPYAAGFPEFNIPLSRFKDGLSLANL